MEEVFHFVEHDYIKRAFRWLNIEGNRPLASILFHGSPRCGRAAQPPTFALGTQTWLRRSGEGGMLIHPHLSLFFGQRENRRLPVKIHSGQKGLSAGNRPLASRGTGWRVLRLSEHELAPGNRDRLLGRLDWFLA